MVKRLTVGHDVVNVQPGELPGLVVLTVRGDSIVLPEWFAVALGDALVEVAANSAGVPAELIRWGLER